ncbi:beta-ketoacyl synthase N-terminal-like domain-containing protein [Saccharothrix sp. BKS2]|uniref:type I polyketide synthase n=1 Tax=Saccharothrix sp. BKS2 TaxID=3064400 RepID=UPI0039E7D67A
MSAAHDQAGHDAGFDGSGLDGSGLDGAGLDGSGFDDTGYQIAVIGMAGRFPGAPDVDALWRNVLAGVDSVTRTVDEEGRTGGYGVLEGAAGFDAGFFGLTPREALITDPQHRVFLECAHHALEDAGYDPAAYGGAIGLFAGGGTTGYLAALQAARAELPMVDAWQLRMATAPDFLTTRVAHKLGLRGPVCTVQSACSTSLVAIHVAAQALLAGDCDIALAGGATVHVPPPAGTYVEGGILAADGHTRAFDADATGTVGGSAAALVVLKPLADALADGDRVHAVLRGTGVANDGGDKIGFTAPGVAGQVRAIRAALDSAEVDAGSVGYVEAHGTGTPLGDPIEVLALTRAFRADTDRTGFCALGSLKTNIGHTDAAAGVAGFIKAVLAVRDGVLPPSLHFTTPNPQIDFASSPFEVRTGAGPWPAGGPRRAGVNALGIGGTNAHAVVEQPPEVVAPPAPERPGHLVVLSARTPAALDELARRTADRLDAAASAGAAPATAAPATTDPADTGLADTGLADLAWTSQLGRRAWPHRRFVVAESAAEAARVLRSGEHDRVVPSTAKAEDKPVVFTFPGQGGQHVGMAAQLHHHEPVFRAAFDECARHSGLDLASVLRPDPAGRDAAVASLDTIRFGQPAVFAVEYALAKLWESWGVRPARVVGHSLGAFAAACVAGVMAVDEAAALVAERGRLLQGLPEGRMAAVRLPEERVRELLPPGLDLGAVNGPDQCTATGPAELVERFAEQLRERGFDARVLRIATAGHSSLVDPITDRFRELVAGVRLSPPTTPVVSDSTGRVLTDAEACDPDYWTAHLRRPVRFGDALEVLLADRDSVLLEVGPGTTLTALARRHPAWSARHVAVNSLPHAAEGTPDRISVLTAAGRLWSAGVPVDFARLHDAPRRRTALPLYPFEHTAFLVEPARARADEPAARVRIERGEATTTGVITNGATTTTTGATTAGATTAGTTPAGTPATGADEDPVRSAVVAAFRDLLGLPEVDPHDGFFDLGGDSLLATQLAKWLRERFEVPVSAKEIFTAPTPTQLTALLRGRTTAARAAGGNS